MACSVKQIATPSRALQDKKYNRYSLKATFAQEKISPSYFANDDIEENRVPVSILEQMKNNHKKCPYWKLLKHYCPCSLDVSIKKEKGSKHRVKFPKPLQKVLIADHCSAQSAHSFVYAILKRLTPLELLGSSLNQKHFYKNIQQLLFVQKYDEISLLYLVRGIKVSKISWLQFSEPLKQKELLLTCADFLITKVICPLIQSFFYFVESSYAKTKLFIFRKRVWHRLRHKAFSEFSKFCKLNVIASSTYEDYVKEAKCLGSAKVNFILKKSSLRPICNLLFKEKGKASVNDHLKTLLVILSFEKERNPSRFGSMGMGKMDFYQKLQKFIMKARRGKVRKLYFVTADVQKCFDSINPSALLDVVSSLIKSDFYVINKYRKNIYGKNHIGRYFESVYNLKDIQHRYGDVEFVQQYTVSRETMLKKIQSLLLCNVIKMGKQYYLQRKGLAQGSKVSSILSAAYFGKIEEKMKTPNGLYDFLIRMEDEYLLITSMKSTAKRFLEDLTLEMKMYDFNINLSKCQASFDCKIEPHGLVLKSPCIKFFGLSFHPSDLIISSDYSSYEGLKATDVITWKLTKNPGKYLRESVQNSLFPKCDAILFDKNINSKLTIQKNVLRIFCMTAVKFHSLVMHLPAESRVDNNPQFFLDIILSLPPLLEQQISKDLRKLNVLKDKNNKCPLPIAKLRSLCNWAFIYNLKRHKSIYKQIIPKIEQIEKKTQKPKKTLKQIKKETWISTANHQRFVKEALNYIHLR